MNNKALANVCKHIPYWTAGSDPKILIVLDPVITEKTDVNYPIDNNQLKFLGRFLKATGIKKKDIMFLGACPPVPSALWKREKQMGEYLKEHRQEILDFISVMAPEMIVPMGKAAARQIVGRAVKITKIRGVPYEDERYACPILPSLGLLHVMSRPENEEIFRADMETFGRIYNNDFDVGKEKAIGTKYMWIKDIRRETPLLSRRKKNKVLCLDCETLGTRFYDPASKLLTVQLTTKDGVSYVIPIDYNPFDKKGLPYTEKNEIDWMPNGLVNNRRKRQIVSDLKELLEDSKVKVVGHNLKFDVQMLKSKLGIKVANYTDDTLIMAHMIDENMLSKSLDDCIRRWVPPMSGYADEFNRDPIHFGKSRMDLVPPHKMLQYAGGDSDAGFRLRRVLTEELRKDKENFNCYKRVPLPALKAFCEIEEEGLRIDIKALRRFERKLRAHQQDAYKKILRRIPSSIKREYAKTGVGLKLTRDAFLRAFLFTHPDGLKLRALVWTNTTKDLPLNERVPSVSSKTHLPYFENVPIVRDIMAFVKNDKMLTTYVGTEKNEKGNPTGLYQYLFDGRIRPSYLLHVTVTGRTSSRDPNGQNFPKRGEFAKEYRRIFIAPPGYVLLECDFSQIELRIVAILSGDKTMLKIYKEGGDIHEATAAAVMGISIPEFRKLPKSERDLKRFQAKAVNFGFIYGMGWRKFMSYAKTEYGINFTEREAQFIRNAFFKLYSSLSTWHNNIEGITRANGFVRAPDGRVRHLPNVNSTDRNISAMAIRQGINSPVQGFASDLGLMAIARLHENVDPKLVKVVGFIHDAIICMAPEDKALEAARTVNRYMETNPLEQWFKFKSPVPLNSEVAIGKDLEKMYEISSKIMKDNFMETWKDIVSTMSNEDKMKFTIPRGMRRKRIVRLKKLH